MAFSDMSLEELKFERDEYAAVMLVHDEKFPANDEFCGCRACELTEDRYNDILEEIAERLRKG